MVWNARYTHAAWRLSQRGIDQLWRVRPKRDREGAEGGEGNLEGLA